MSDFIFSVNATLPIFLTMLLGTLLRRAGVMDEPFTDYLNAFVFRVALPTLLFMDLAGQDFASAWDGRFVLFCLATTLVSIVLIAAAPPSPASRSCSCATRHGAASSSR